MFYARCPDDDTVRAALERARGLGFSYAEQGATRGEPPRGYTSDRYGTELGRVPFDRARDAIGAYKMYPAPWTRVVALDAEIREGALFGALIHHLGFWSLNPCRILDVVDEADRYGFAFGTVWGHSERGEERFLVSRDAAGLVRYDVVAFSRPAHVLARLGAPVARHLQLRFQRDTCEAMRRAVSG